MSGCLIPVGAGFPSASASRRCGPIIGHGFQLLTQFAASLVQRRQARGDLLLLAFQPLQPRFEIAVFQFLLQIVQGQAVTQSTRQLLQARVALLLQFVCLDSARERVFELFRVGDAVLAQERARPSRNCLAFLATSSCSRPTCRHWR